MKHRKRIFGVILSILLLGASFTTNAASDSYVLDGIQRISIPALYEKDEVFQSFTDENGEVLYLSKPQDLYISQQGNIFIVDSGNNRVIKVNSQGTVIGIYNDANGSSFNNPQGIYVDEDENMYIADTDNGRIVHLDSLGNYVEELGKPDGLPGSETSYNPAKLSISSTGTIYVVKGQNILSIDANNNFKGYIGQTEIGFDLTDALIRIFASEEQQATLTRRTAATYNNIAIDEKDNLYCASRDSKIGEIKKLNTVGTNTYHETGGASAFSINIASIFLSNSYISSSGTAFYGDRTDDQGESIEPNLVDVAFDKNGLVYALDAITCRVFVYDAEGELLGTVGSTGNQKGKFVTPSAIGIAEDGTIYVLDSNLNSVQSFKQTAFKESIAQALTLYYGGKYVESQAYWKEVLAVNENYNLALKGMGQTCYKEGDYTKAIHYFKQAGDVDGYSDAYGRRLHDWIRANFYQFVIYLILIVGVCLAYFYMLNRASKSVCVLHDTANEKRFEYPQMLKLCFATLFHPCETLENVRYMRGKLKWSPALIFVGLTVLVRIIYMNIIHYPLADVDLKDASYLLEAIKFILPFVTFIIAAYAVTAILEGEVKFKELFFAGSLCFSPYFVFTLPLGAFSHVLTGNNAKMFSTIQTILLIWMLFLFFTAVRVTNRYSVKKTVSIVILSIITMVLIWIVAFLILVLWNQLYLFITGVLTEVGIITG